MSQYYCIPGCWDLALLSFKNQSDEDEHQGSAKLVAHAPNFIYNQIYFDGWEGALQGRLLGVLGGDAVLLHARTIQANIFFFFFFAKVVFNLLFWPSNAK